MPTRRSKTRARPMKTDEVSNEVQFSDEETNQEQWVVA
jgi:hypothetical protein